jgi:hypothetical protein
MNFLFQFKETGLANALLWIRPNLLRLSYGISNLLKDQTGFLLIPVTLHLSWSGTTTRYGVNIRIVIELKPAKICISIQAGNLFLALESH